MSESVPANDLNLVELSSYMSPEPIYDSISLATTVWAALLPVFFSLFALIKLKEEVDKVGNGKASFGKMLLKCKDVAIETYLYLFLGGILLALISYLGSYFYKHGSFSILANDISKVYDIINNIERKESRDGILALLDYLSVGSIPFSYTFFQIASCICGFTLSILRVAYALMFGIYFCWGFLAIPSGMVSGSLNFKTGWQKGMAGLAIWPMIDATFYLLLKGVVANASANILANYGDAPMAALSATYTAIGVICVLVIFVSIFAATITGYLIMNESAMNGLLAPGAAALYTVMNALNKSGNAIGSGISSPETGGDRMRDKLMNLNNTAVGSTASGMGNLLSSLGADNQQSNQNTSSGIEKLSPSASNSDSKLGTTQNNTQQPSANNSHQEDKSMTNVENSIGSGNGGENPNQSGLGASNLANNQTENNDTPDSNSKPETNAGNWSGWDNNKGQMSSEPSNSNNSDSSGMGNLANNQTENNDIPDSNSKPETNAENWNGRDNNKGQMSSEPSNSNKSDSSGMGNLANNQTENNDTPDSNSKPETNAENWSGWDNNKGQMSSEPSNSNNSDSSSMGNLANNLAENTLQGDINNASHKIDKEGNS